jgi:hypothetical protein
MTNRPELQALARAIAAILIGVQLAGWISFLPIALGGHADFRQLYTAGYMLRTGQRHALYDFAAQKALQDSLVSPEQNALPFNHLPYEATLFAPLSFMPYQAAYFTFLALNMLLFIAALRMLRPAFALGDHLFWMGICFLPVSVALMQGQDSIILLALFSGAFVQLSRDKEMSAGFLLGLGFFKFQLLLPIVLLFLCWKRWRFCVASAATAAATMVASLLLVGWEQMRLYAQSLTAMSVGLSSQASQVKYGISPADMPNLRGLVYGFSNGYLNGAAQQLIVLLTSLVVLGLVAAKARPRTGAGALLLSIAASAIVSYHLLAHDWSILLIPILAVASGLRTKGNLKRPVSWNEAFLLLMFLAPLLLTFGRNYFFLGSLPLIAFLIFLVRDKSTTGNSSIGLGDISKEPWPS